MNVKLPAVILAAGRGERLSEDEKKPPKPLISVLGLTLLERAILSCKEAGIEEFFIVLGYRKEEIESFIAEWETEYRISITPVENRSWLEGNGSSVLACSPHLSSSFLLIMCDHLFDPQVIPHLVTEGKDEGACYLLVDRRIARVFDREDATRVQVNDGRITAIGKGLEPYNCIDTGIFLCRPFLFDALREAQAGGDGSLSGGIRRLAEQGRIRAVDLGEGFWLDVDTPQALKHGRKLLLRHTIKANEDGFIAEWLNRRISVPLSAWLVTYIRATRLNPNAISLASFLIVLLGAFFFIFTSYAATLAAGILVQIGSIVDGCDGEVARLTSKKSRFGAWLDTLLDRYGDSAVATGITYGFWQLYPTPWVWVGGIFALAGFLLSSYTKKEYALCYEESVPRDVWVKLIKRDLRLFTLFLGAAFGYPYFALLAVGLLAHLGIGRLFWKVYQGEECAGR